MSFRHWVTDDFVRVANGLAAVSFVVLLVLQIRRIWLNFYKFSLPPGPPAIPIVGNILKVPSEGAWLAFTEYKREYGDLVFFHGLGQNVLVLNTLQTITDFLDKRWDINSHRPSFTVVGELMGLNQSMPLMPYGNEWRANRRLAHVALSNVAIKKYHPIQEDLAALMCNDILNKPEDFFALVRLTAGRTVLSVSYGLSAASADSEYITFAEETMHLISRCAVPGAFLCDLLPFLKYSPSWVPFQRTARQGKAMIERLVTKPFEFVKSQIAAGTAGPSLTKDLLTMPREDMKDFEHHVKWTTGAMYGAGGETTYAVVLTFMLAIALHPDVQARAQAELDKIVGNNRLPTVADIPNLPYLHAVVKETMRWHPVVPLSIARRSGDDNVYNGYFIPKGTIVIPNLWCLAMEPNEQYDPREFIPERFLDPTQNILDPMSYVFGFGRRICPGKALGTNSVFILLASILASFNVSPTEKGLVPEFDLSLVSFPKPFECRIKPRSKERAEIIRQRAALSKT